MNPVILYIIGTLFVVKGLLLAYVARQAAYIDLRQDCLLGVRTKLTKQSLQNWNVGNFAGRTLLGLQSFVFVAGGASLLIYNLTSVAQWPVFWVIAGFVVATNLFFYIGNMVVANNAIKHYVDVAS